MHAVTTLGRALICGAFLAPVGCSTVLGIDADYREGTEEDRAAPYREKCAALAAAACAFRKPCCKGETTGPCVDNVMKGCEGSIPDILDGKRNFDEAQHQACLAALATPLEQCNFDLEGFLNLQVSLAGCFKRVTGSTPAGSPCLVNEDCQPVPAAQKGLICANNTCTLAGQLEIGDPCTIMRVDCGVGRYCKQESPTSPDGTCDVAHSIGQPCKANECGPGVMCTGSPQTVCIPGFGMGHDCDKPNECATANCVGKCAPWPAVTPEQCAGG